MQAPRVLLFGDQLVEKFDAVRKLYGLSKTRPQLHRFLGEATDVLEGQLSQLTLAERRPFGHFVDLSELAELYAAQEHPDEVVGACLITATQIGDLLAHAEDDPSVLNVESQSNHQLGFCIGLIAAAVAAAARDTSEIITLGVECISITFRMVLELTRRARTIEDTDKSWGCTIAGIDTEDVQNRLDKFNEVFPTPVHAYVGVATSTWTTVFGPPATLEVLHRSPGFEDLHTSPLVAATAVHAPHLFPIDSHHIVGDSPILARRLLSGTCISSSICAPFQADTLKDLLQLVVADVAHNPLWLEESVKALGARLQGASEIALTTLGPTPHTAVVKHLLSQSVANIRLTTMPSGPSEITSSRGGSGLIAVVGMSGRFPGADTLEQFWDVLQAGTSMHEEIPASRFALDEIYDPSEEIQNSVSTRYGCFLKNPGDFDSRFFNISPREALRMDPIQRMLLMATYEAMEMAGYAHDAGPSVHPSRISTFFGQTSEDWRTINDQQGITTHYLPCINRAFGPGRLNHYFKWGGGSYSIDTACSSSLTSTLLACRALIAREVDTAIVGGGSLLVLPELFSGLSKGGFLSSTGACKSFANNADGYCRGEAVGVVVLKRLEDAIRENDNVLAVIRATARNSNAGEGSITFPGEAAQEALYRKILRASNLDPQDIGFVEMHGTATQAGDMVEMTAVRNVLAQSRSADNPLIVGTLKATIGHSEAAAGVVSLIKTVLMLQNNKIPPQPGYPFPLNNRYPDLDDAKIQIADNQAVLTPWSKGDGKRKVLINSFDAAGGNTSVVVEDRPLPLFKEQDLRSHHVVLCSARTPTSLAANKARLHEYLSDTLRDVDVADVAYTTTARRLHDVCRESYVVSSIQELIGKLQSSDSVHVQRRRQPNASQSLVFVFTGQSSQYTAMGATLYESSPSFRRMLGSYETIGNHLGLAPFLGIIRGSHDIASASPGQVQLAIVALEIALAQFWQSLGLQPSLVIGHSLGEYAALCVAGVLSVSDTLYLVHQRATLMQSRCGAGRYTMLAVQLPATTLQDFLAARKTSTWQISCINGPSLTVLSGPSNEVASLENDLAAKNVSVIRLHVSYGFHSSQMDSVLDEFERVASRVHFRTPTIPVASTLFGNIVKDHGVFNAEYLAQQMRRPVRMLEAVRNAEVDGLINDDSVVFEVGPHPVCLGFITSSLQHVVPTCYPSLQRGQDAWKTVSSCLAGAYQASLPVNWQEFHKDFLHCTKLLDLPRYAFDLKTFWVPYKREAPERTTIDSALEAGSGHSTTTLQILQSVEARDGRFSAVFVSRTSEQNLFRTIQGHLVDGIAICPAAVFIEMAYAATSFLLEQTGSAVDWSKLKLTDLRLTHPLVVASKDPTQVIRIEATLDEASASVSLRYSSVAQGHAAEHGHCQVLIDDDGTGWKSDWTRTQRLVKGRVDILTRSSATGAAHRLAKPLMYKLFASLVDYDHAYQALDEVFVDDSFKDAAAYMSLGVANGLGTFSYSPYLLDALVHLAGFILNGAVNRAPDDIHISNQVESLQIVGSLSENRQLTCFTSITEQSEKGMTSCDVYVYDHVGLVALCTGIRFQKLSRPVFGAMVGKNQVAAAAVPTGTVPIQRMPRRAVRVSESDTSAEEFIRPESESRVSIASSRTSVGDLSLSTMLLDAIACRTGVPLADMLPSVGFADMGIDSLMSIEILSDLKKQTGCELPAAFFSNFPTVADAREALDGEVAPSLKSADRSTAKTRTKQARRIGESAQPRSSDPLADTVMATTNETSTLPLLRLLANELGMGTEELTPDTTFASIGVDSMLSIKVLSLFRKKTGIELPAAIFTSHPTVADLWRELDGELPATQSTKSLDASANVAVTKVQNRGLGAAVGKTQDPRSQGTQRLAIPRPLKQNPSVTKILQSASGSNENASKPSPTQPGKPQPESRAILIQGKPKSIEAPLFLATDGSGTVGAYIHMPALPGGRRIYALESPFIECPDDFTLTVQQMADLFIQSIVKIQPRGPYLIGGWSAGGIYAYEIAHKLALKGEKILGLVIMDMRVPHSVPDPDVTMAFVEKVGAFTGVNRASNFLHGVSDKQKVHLTSTVGALVRYDPTPFPEDSKPLQTYIIWATKGLNDSPKTDEHDDRITGPAAMGPGGMGKALSDMTMEEQEIELKSWFFAKRYDFGMNGWEDFVGNNIAVHTVDGDHFSIVVPPQVARLGAIVLEAVRECAKLEN